MVPLSVRVDRWVKQGLEAEALEKGFSVSEIVRDALTAYVRRRECEESCSDLARRLGILGVYKDGPSDLSTNPEYMEGFGRD